MRNVLKNVSQLLTSREVQSGRCWSLRYCLFLSCFILSVIFIINFDFYIFSLFLGKFPLALNFSVDILSDIILFFKLFIISSANVVDLFRAIFISIYYCSSFVQFYVLDTDYVLEKKLYLNFDDERCC